MIVTECANCIYYDNFTSEFPCNICEQGVSGLPSQFSQFETWDKSELDGDTQGEKNRLSEYEKAINGMIERCGAVLTLKHKEYASEDDFHNFNVAAELQGITPEQALVGMMDKHVVSVHDLVNEMAEGRLIDTDTWAEKIGDNINYLLILWAMVSMHCIQNND